MSNNKKYYWFKLKDSFFSELAIKAILKMPNGPELIIIYVQILLQGLKTDGFIRYQSLLPSLDEELALSLDSSNELITSALDTLIHFSLIQRIDDNTLYLPSLETLTGSETASAERVRKHRSSKKKLHSNIDEIALPDSLQCNTEKREKRKEKDLELEIKEEIDKNCTVTSSPLSTTQVAPEDDYADIMSAWNSTSFTKIVTISHGSKRELQLSTLLNEHKKETVLETISKATTSDFLKGSNPRGWVMSFDWFISPTNFLKVLEGNFVDTVSHSPDKKNQFTRMYTHDWDMDELERLAAQHTSNILNL